MTNLIVYFRNFSNSPKSSMRGLSYTCKQVCAVAYRWWNLSDTYRNYI